MKTNATFCRAIICVTFLIAFDMMMALAVAQPSLSKSASISCLVEAAANESTKIVTNLSLSDSLILVTIVSMVSNIYSQVSRCTYNILVVSTPIALKYS